MVVLFFISAMKNGPIFGIYVALAAPILIFPSFFICLFLIGENDENFELKLLFVMGLLSLFIIFTVDKFNFSNNSDHECNEYGPYGIEICRE